MVVTRLVAIYEDQGFAVDLVVALQPMAKFVAVSSK
jgi:hypothetical protein